MPKNSAPSDRTSKSMSERQKLLDAARSAVNLLDAAQSAVDLLNAVLGQEEENDCNDNHGKHGEEKYTDSGSTSKIISKSAPKAEATRALAESALGPVEVEDNMKLRHQYQGPLETQRAALVTITTDDGEKGETDNHAQMNYEKTENEPRFVRKVNQRIPSQVAKVTPQRPIAFGKHDDVTDDSIGIGGGGSTESRSDGWDHDFKEFIIEQAQASSILFLENAKLREELQEAKNEVEALNQVLSKKQVDKKDEEVQTIGSCVFGNNIYHVPRFDEFTSDDDTDYLTTFSNSYHDKHYNIQVNRTDGMTGKGGDDVYFCTPASNISTPGTLGRGSRASTVSSSGGGLVKRKLELPKSLKKCGGYLSITSYEPMTSEEYESSVTSPGCCPFACFKRLHGRKATRN